MKIGFARGGYKMGRLYVEQFPADNRAQRNEEVRIGRAFFKVVFRIGNWYLLKCLVDWSFEG